MRFQMRFTLILACLLATSCSSSSNVSQPTVTATEAPTMVPTITKTTTPTNTPKPTKTFTPTPTETPGPYWQTPFGEFIHAVNNKNQEMFNFKAPFDEWPTVKDLGPSTIAAYHDSLKTIKLSDGSPLIKPTNTEDFTSLDPLFWKIFNTPYGKMLSLNADNVGDPNNLRARWVGGATFQFDGDAKQQFSAQFVLLTMQVEDRSQPDGYSLWTGLFLREDLEGMLSGRVPALFNNNSQLAPYMNFDKQAADRQYIDELSFMLDEAYFDESLYEQALMDYYNGVHNNYLYNHLLIANIGGTRWHPPK